jgi:hypothetical protein
MSMFNMFQAVEQDVFKICGFSNVELVENVLRILEGIYIRIEEEEAWREEVESWGNNADRD